jgi:hypothetical protein
LLEEEYDVLMTIGSSMADCQEDWRRYGCLLEKSRYTSIMASAIRLVSRPGILWEIDHFSTDHIVPLSYLACHESSYPECLWILLPSLSGIEIRTLSGPCKETNGLESFPNLFLDPYVFCGMSIYFESLLLLRAFIDPRSRGA